MHERLKAKKWTGQAASYAHRKYDGHRFTLFKSLDGVVTAFGGEMRDDLEMLSRFPRLHDLEVVRRFDSLAPKLSSLDCELVTDGRASDVPTALRDPNRLLQLHPFALPWWDGEDLSRATIDIAQRHIIDDLWLPFVDYEVLEGDVDKDEWLAKAKALKIEGWVLKNFNYAEWWKLKEEETVDCVITGVKEGNGKYVGLIGSLVVSLEGRVIANVSGMTDAERIELTDLDCDDKLIGRVVEVKYQYVGNGGKLRHPRFVRMRDDKPASECKLDQIE